MDGKYKVELPIWINKFFCKLKFLSFRRKERCDQIYVCLNVLSFAIQFVRSCGKG
jgi:hypothetical protein